MSENNQKRSKKVSNTILKIVKQTNTDKKTKQTNQSIKSSKNKFNTKGLSIKLSWARVVIFFIVAVIAVGVGFAFKTPIENLLNPNQNSLETSATKVIDENGLTVHFIDVGQGDAIAIKFPDNKKMLVDAGTSKSADTLVSYLKNNFFKNDSIIFDYLLLTHSDADHCGGMVKVCKEFIINKIYRPYMYCKYAKNDVTIYDETNGSSTNKNVCDTATYYNTIMAFKNEINSSGQKADIVWTDLNTITNEQNRIVGIDYSIDFYAPTQKYITTSAGTVANDFSPIMVLNYNSKKIMLTGDASITSENDAMAKYTLPQVDLLKVGHHGSATSSGQEFLNKIKPKYAVISVGANNSYKHPTQEALNRLLNIGAEVFRTDKNGTIIANVTTGAAELNIFAAGKPEGLYIHIEYLISGVIILSASLCFGTKLNVSKKKEQG